MNLTNPTPSSPSRVVFHEIPCSLILIPHEKKREKETHSYPDMEGLIDMKEIQNDSPAMDSSSSSSSSSSEISIFDAHKYYKERVAPPVVAAARHCEFHASAVSPTAAWSEVSWSSETELLWNSPVLNMQRRTITKEKRKMWRTRKLFFGIILLCGCWRRKKKKEKSSENQQTVYDDDDDDDDLIPEFLQDTTQLAGGELASGSGSEFSFPILGEPPPSAKLVFTSALYPIPLEEPPRDSLEIFLPPEPCVSRKPADGISPPIFAPGSWGGAAVDDVASDGSSDLFEIEIFTTHQTTNSPMYEYEPSEASIDRSCATWKWRRRR